MSGLGARIGTRLRIVGAVALHGTLPGTVTFDDFTPDFRALLDRVEPYTMTSPERLFAVRDAIHYVAAGQIPGAVVECGVWRGGSSMMAALAMQEVGLQRDLWLYDTFEGIPEPGDHDRDLFGVPAQVEYRARVANEGSWMRAGLDDVRANLASTGYDDSLITYVQGPVEETIPGTLPDEIAVLRLDTDWYESTRHDLEHLWPRLSPGGVLIIDDYGHFAGARKAVDEYFAETPVLLARVDYTCRMAVKR